MYKQKIGISVGADYSMPMAEVIKIIKDAGFDAISPAWVSGEELTRTAAVARELGLELQSLHAPFNKAAAMWSADVSIYAPVKAELFDCIDYCEDLDIPVMVVHTWIGFDYKFDKGSLYYKNFEDLISYATAHNVKIAFENTEGIEYLWALMEHFENDDTVGFCWDSGHEMCYNYSEDLLLRLGDRLIMTHLNDNLGQRGDHATMYDDLHMVMGDGVIDWHGVMQKIRRTGYRGMLMCELNAHHKWVGHHEMDRYEAMGVEEFYAYAYKAALRITSL